MPLYQRSGNHNDGLLRDSNHVPPDESREDKEMGLQPSIAG